VSPRLPEVVLWDGEDEARPISLQFFRIDEEQRLLSFHEDRTIRVWAYRASDGSAATGREWSLLTCVSMPFKGPIYSISFDAPSKRLIYIEELKESGGGPPEGLRVISRLLTFQPEGGE
jgi:hypothetical protein